MRQGLGALAAKIPGLALFCTGALSFIGGFFLKKIVTLLIDKTILGISIAIAGAQIETEKDDYESAVKNAYDQMRSNKRLTQKQKDDLDQAVLEAAKKFIHIRQTARQQNQSTESEIEWH